MIADNNSTVNDGIPDWWKVAHGFALTDIAVAGGDADRDGFTNLEEYLAGTDPRNVNSRPDAHPSAVLTIPNAWAIYASSNTVQVTADIRSTNWYVTVQAAEVFLDTPGPTGHGLPLSAVDGRFDSTNETGTVTFIPTFPSGQRHELFIHAQGKDKQWSAYKKIVINPNVNDILDKIQTNYSAFADLQFNVTLTETHNGVVVETHTATYRMKGPYKIRTEYIGGTVAIKNENMTWWYNAGLHIGGSLVSALNGDSSATANRKSDFFWDVPLCKTQTDATISNSVNSAIFDIQLTPKTGSTKSVQHARIAASTGLIRELNVGTTDVVLKSEYLNPTEVIPGHWLHTLHRYTMDFADGDEIVKTTTLTNILVNQGMPDSLFDVPTH